MKLTFLNSRKALVRKNRFISVMMESMNFFVVVQRTTDAAAKVLKTLQFGFLFEGKYNEFVNLLR